MKQIIPISAFGVILIYGAQSLFAQGSLTPPGGPAPTMKSLDQIEPRAPVSSAPFVISQPGAYYLTANLTVSSGDAITIATNNVTLDLKGFTISSTRPAAATDSAILLSASWTNVAIYNGHISSGVINSSGTFSGTGFGYGVYSPSSTPSRNVRVKDVSVLGVLFDGISIGNNDTTLVESCTVRTAGGFGIAACTIKNSLALDCGSSGISATQAFESHGEGNGIGVFCWVMVQNCYGAGGVTGIFTYGTAQDCYGMGSGLQPDVNAAGVYAADTANHCSGYGYGGAYGTYAIIAQNCYGFSDTSDGIHATAMAINCYGNNNSGSGFDGVYSSYIASHCYGYSAAGVGLGAFIADVCGADTSTGTKFSVVHNVNSY